MNKWTFNWASDPNYHVAVIIDVINTAVCTETTECNQWLQNITSHTFQFCGRKWERRSSWQVCFCSCSDWSTPESGRLFGSFSCETSSSFPGHHHHHRTCPETQKEELWMLAFTDFSSSATNRAQFIWTPETHWKTVNLSFNHGCSPLSCSRSRTHHQCYYFHLCCELSVTWGGTASSLPSCSEEKLSSSSSSQ